MKNRTKTPVVILALNTEDTMRDLMAIQNAGLGRQYLKTVEGLYQGKTQNSYVINVGYQGDRFGELNQETLNMCLNLAESFNQESVLFLGYNRTADLIYCKSREVVSLGHWKSVSKREAMMAEAWTRSGNQYFLAK